MHERYSIPIEPDSEHSDVPLEHHGPQAAAAMPAKMPWRPIAEADSPTDQADADAINMDNVPAQYELHSNTKSHQLGGIYESYSSSQPQDG